MSRCRFVLRRERACGPRGTLLVPRPKIEPLAARDEAVGALSEGCALDRSWRFPRRQPLRRCDDGERGGRRGTKIASATPSSWPTGKRARSRSLLGSLRLRNQLLFIDFEGQSRVRVNGTATVDPDDPLLRRGARRRSSSASRCARCSRTARATSTSSRSCSARASCRRRAPRHPCPRGSAPEDYEASPARRSGGPCGRDQAT